MHIEVPLFSAKWVIGFFGLFHTSVGALSIGLAFVVTVAQILAYKKRIRAYDLFAKRAQLFHVCIYNVGTINAIGLVFALSGLYPQFWEQIFVHHFWTLIIEEILFLLLATTVTFHYFFWDKLWGHKKMHIFLGSLLIPLFFLQIYIINGIGAFMLTPGFAEGEATLSGGLLGWDKTAFYNPSFLMLQFHRTFANISYAGFFLAMWCGIRLSLTRDRNKIDYYEDCGKLSFYIAFTAFLSLPIIGYFYAHVLKIEANEAYLNLMVGRGDILIGGIDMWWIKHGCVAAMIGGSLTYYNHVGKNSETPFSLPRIMVYMIAAFFIMFYLAMGMVMTWTFFWVELVIAVGSGFFVRHMIQYRKGSGRAVFIYIGILSFLTVMLGGYVREASRPRFVNRISHYDSIYIPEERAPVLMVDVTPEELEKLTAVPPEPVGTASLINERCTQCHTLERVRNYPKDDWDRVVRKMIILGTKLNEEQAAEVIAHLEEGKPF